MGLPDVQSTAGIQERGGEDMNLTTREFMTLIHTLEATISGGALPPEKDRIELIDKINETVVIPTIDVKVGDVPQLTKRQRDILQLVAEGETIKAIAVKLFMSPSTVKRTVSDILDRLGANNRPHAVAIARGVGLL